MEARVEATSAEAGWRKAPVLLLLLLLGQWEEGKLRAGLGPQHSPLEDALTRPELLVSMCERANASAWPPPLRPARPSCPHPCNNFGSSCTCTCSVVYIHLHLRPGTFHIPQSSLILTLEVRSPSWVHMLHCPVLPQQHCPFIPQRLDLDPRKREYEQRDTLSLSLSVPSPAQQSDPQQIRNPCHPQVGLASRGMALLLKSLGAWADSLSSLAHLALQLVLDLLLSLLGRHHRRAVTET